MKNFLKILQIILEPLVVLELQIILEIWIVLEFRVILELLIVYLLRTQGFQRVLL